MVTQQVPITLSFFSFPAQNVSVRGATHVTCNPRTSRYLEPWQFLAQKELFPIKCATEAERLLKGNCRSPKITLFRGCI